jgi:hypothetical protein
MKRFFRFAAVLSVAVLASVGCQKNVAPPVVTFGGGNSVSVNAGESKEVAITVTTKGKLKSVAFFTKQRGSDEEVLYGTPVVKFPNKGKYESVVTLKDIATGVTLIAEATDAKDKTTRAEYVVSVNGEVSASVPTGSYDNVELGFNYLKTVGSSFNLKTGTAPLLADAKTIAGDVDFMFFWGKVNGVTITAPSDDLAAEVFNNPIYGVQTWGTRNATTFVKLEASAFDSASLSAIETQLASGDTHVNHLSVGDVVAFKTTAGQIGVVKLTTVGPNSASTLNISVKVLK